MNPNDLITEDKKNKPKKVDDLRTLLITEQKGKNKFSIYEHNRKTGKYRKIQTIQNKKSLSQTLEDIRLGKITILNQYVTETKTTNSTVRYTQTNNLLTKSRLFPQLVALVRVVDIERRIEQTYVGFSRQFPGVRPNEFQKEQLREDCKTMAIGKYYSEFRPGQKYDKHEFVEAYIEAERWQYIKVKYDSS